MDFEVTLSILSALSICLSRLIELAGANTDTAILSSSYFQIFLHSHNSQWQPGGGEEEAAYQIPSAPLPPALTSITRLQLSFLPDV